MLVDQFFNCLEIPGLRHDDARTHQDRFKNHSSNLTLVFDEYSFQCIDVIKRDDAHTVGYRLRNSCAWG